jgi:class 3 adenylate cyclase/tetratricopeptide (TPR) repeat protein
MAGSPSPDVLVRYVPPIAAAWEADGDDSTWREVDGTLCMVDISGFTALSERLAAFGRVGAEELTEVLSAVFASMTDLVHARGGEQLSFGGDALLLLFTGDDHLVQGACAAVEMRAALRAASRSARTSAGRIDLRMSVGLASGVVHLFRVGGSHRQLLVAGPLASLVTRLEKAAGPGEIVVGPRSRRALGVDAAPVARRPGWALRWRRAPVAPAGPTPSRPSADCDLDVCVPESLRPVLRGGTPQPEHRRATVGFLRLTGVDDLLAVDGDGPGLAAAALDESVRAVQAAADREAVTFLAADIDDGGGKVILATGVPATLGDDEGRMLRVLREVVDCPLPLTVQAGAHHGHVFAGVVGGAERGATYTVMGDTVNVAARLMAAAPPGAVYTTAAVLSGSHTRFDAERLAPLRAKGKAAPLQAFALGEEGGPSARTAGVDVPFTGRRAELSRLVGMLRLLRTGSGSAVVVEGEVGQGKSRLVDAALRGARDVSVVTFGTEPFRTATAYRPLRDALRRLLGLERASGDRMAAELRERLAAVAPDLLPWLPLVGDLTHVDVPGSTEEVDALEPRFRPQRTADVMADLLDATAPGALAIVVEDAQATDAATTTVLEVLAARARADRPWMVVAVRRPGDGGFAPADAARIELGPLDDATARDLVDAATSAPMLPHDVDRIVERAEGNPLYLVELVRTAHDLGGLEHLPSTLDALVRAQIDALPAPARAVLRRAAVLGRSFRPVALRELLDGAERALDDASNRALGELLEPTDDERIRFRHALVRDVAYEGLPFRERRTLHRRAGEGTERAAAGHPEAVADLLALHFGLAGDHRRAWRYGVMAGDRARESFANTEAAANYRRAVEAARHLEEVDDRERADVMMLLGDVDERAGDFPSALDAYRRAGRLLVGDALGRAHLALRRARVRERMGDYTVALGEVSAGVRVLDGLAASRAARDDVGSAGDDDAAGDEAARVRARLAAFRAVVRQAQERPRPARDAARIAVDVASATDAPDALARAYEVLDWAARALGEPVHEPLGPMARQLYHAAHDPEGEARVTANLGVLHYLRGEWDEAARLYEQAVVATERLGDAVGAAVTAANQGELLVSQGRILDAGPVLRSAARVMRASAFVDGAAFAELQIGRLLVARGDPADAVEVLGRVHDELAALGQPASALEAALHLADAMIELADQARSSDGPPRDGHGVAVTVERALALLDEAEERAGGDAGWLAPASALVRSRALVAQGDLPAAADLVATGLERARAEELPYELVLLLRASAELATARGLQVDLGEVAEARRVGGSLGLLDAGSWRPDPTARMVVRVDVTAGTEDHPLRRATR